jgi:hypothetical protein
MLKKYSESLTQLEYLQELDAGETISISQIPDSLNFVSDSQDVKPINDLYDTDYDSFFVEIANGDYSLVMGMYGIIPYLDKTCYKIA